MNIYYNYVQTRRLITNKCRTVGVIITVGCRMISFCTHFILNIFTYYSFISSYIIEFNCLVWCEIAGCMPFDKNCVKYCSQPYLSNDYLRLKWTRKCGSYAAIDMKAIIKSNGWIISIIFYHKYMQSRILNIKLYSLERTEWLYWNEVLSVKIAEWK